MLQWDVSLVSILGSFLQITHLVVGVWLAKEHLGHCVHDHQISERHSSIIKQADSLETAFFIFYGSDMKSSRGDNPNQKNNSRNSLVYLSLK